MSNSNFEFSSLEKLVNFYEQQNRAGDFTFFEAEDFIKIIEFYRQANNKSKALSTCRNALKHFPFNINLLFLRTQLYLADFEYDYAIQTLEKITIIEPANAKAYFMIAEAYLNQGEPDEALEMLDIADDLKYNQSEVLKLRAELNKLLENNDDSLNAFEQYLHINPLDYDVALDYIITGYIADRQNRVLFFLEDLTNRNPQSYLAWFILGKAYECFENYKTAIENLEISKLLNPDYGQTVYLLALCYFKQEDYLSALELFKQAAEFSVNIDFSNIQAGFCCIYLEKFKDARQFFKKAKEINPDDPDIYFGLGLIEFNSEQYNKAIRNYRKAIKIFEYSATYWSELAFTYAHTGKYIEANKAYKEALELEPDDIEIQLDYLYFLREIGWTFIAIGEAMKFLDVENPDIEVMYFTSGLLFDCNYHEEAVNMFINALSINHQEHQLLFQHFPHLYSNQLIQSLIEQNKPV